MAYGNGEAVNLKNMKQLHQLLDQIESHIPNHERVNHAISLSCIGWQLDHSLLVINFVIAQLKNSNPENYQWKFKWIRTYIQITNTIPRGKVRVPKSVNPIDVATIEELQTKLDQARQGISELQTLHKNNYFTHPFFGDLNLKAAIWFLKLHTNHHLKIIKDIMSKG